MFQKLAEFSSIAYGYSYMLGWIGVGFAAIAAVLFICASMSADDADNDDTSPLAMKVMCNRLFSHPLHTEPF